MIIFLVIILIILTALNVAMFILIQNLNDKVMIYERWIVEFKLDVVNTLEEMRDIDKQGVFSTRINDKGLFESDDQVGGIFKDIMDLIEKLNQRTQ